MSFCTFHLDALASGATLAPGRHVLSGWVWPKPGRHIVDVRARIDGRVFAAVHGYPQRDLAARFTTGSHSPLAGFRVPIDLPAGPVTVILEALEIEGHWTPFQTMSLRGAGPAGAIPPPVVKPLHSHDFTRSFEFLLRSRRGRSEASWVRLATALAAELPVNQDALSPAAPFIGHADEPAVANRSRFGLLPVVGYLFHHTQKIRKLWVTAELQTLQPLTLGRATANLAGPFPQFPNALVSGYEGFVDVPPQLPNPVSLRIYAETESSELHLVQVRTTRRHDAEIEKYPCQGTRLDFDEALTAWKSALRVRGFAILPEPNLPDALAGMHADFTRPASAPRPAITRRAPRPLRRVLLATHNLNLEGAPLFLLDLARGLAASGLQLTILSPSDGSLRARFAALGAEIVIVDASAVFQAPDAAGAAAALDALGRAVDFAAADLVISNTFTAFWAVHAAKAAGTPVLSYVHESTSPAAFYGRDLSPAVLALVEDALRLADAVSFTSDATRRYHAGPGRDVRAVLTPGWVDLAWIDGWLAQNPREILRDRFNLQPGEILVTNIGTICDRKAQLGFARSVALFNARHPDLARRVRFVLLGGRQAWFDRYLGEVLAGLALPNLVVHPETPDFLGYYAAADFTVCSSLEESSPRVVLEAMACGTPLLASDIPGISEMARHGSDAVLLPPGHTTVWADQLAAVLLDPATAAVRAKNARARIESDFAAAIVLPRHLALARAVAAGQSVA